MCTGGREDPDSLLGSGTGWRRGRWICGHTSSLAGSDAASGQDGCGGGCVMVVEIMVVVVVVVWW